MSKVSAKANPPPQRLPPEFPDIDDNNRRANVVLVSDDDDIDLGDDDEFDRKIVNNKNQNNIKNTNDNYSSLTKTSRDNNKNSNNNNSHNGYNSSSDDKNEIRSNENGKIVLSELNKGDDLYVNDEAPKVLPLRPIIRGPYNDNDSDDDHIDGAANGNNGSGLDTTVVYTEQHTEVKLNCDVDLDVSAVVWMHNGQVRNFDEYSMSDKWLRHQCVSEGLRCFFLPVSHSRCLALIKFLPENREIKMHTENYSSRLSRVARDCRRQSALHH